MLKLILKFTNLILILKVEGTMINGSLTDRDCKSKLPEGIMLFILILTQILVQQINV